MKLARTQLKAAINGLENRLDLFDTGVLNTILAVLQEQLDTVDSHAAPPAQRKQVTVLFANISGFTQAAQTMRDTNLLNVLNLLWQQLDTTIKAHGGTVDKHLGDGVLGVFGMHVTHEDDPVRAVRAALGLRAALSDFLQGLREMPLATLTAHGRDDGLTRLQDLSIRIGVNTGPVLLGRVGTKGEYTVIGDAVNVGRRLEQAAPADGILIAHDTYAQVQGLFNVKAVGPLRVKGRTDPVTAYLVTGAKPRPLRVSNRGVEGVETRIVGRDSELQQLQAVAQRALETRRGQLLTITGEAGVGKSRLVHEWNRWVQKTLAPDVLVMKGRAEAEERPLPFTLMRDLFSSYFDIQDSDRAAIAEEKLVRGIRQFLPQGEADVRRRARVIAQLIGLGGVEGEIVHPDTEPVQLRERAFRYLAGFFAAITAVSRLAVVMLEDIHWSDPESLVLVKHLSRICRREPLLIISLTRPSFFEKTPDWLQETGGVRHDSLSLRPLPQKASHRLVRHILRRLPDVPAALVDLIVARAEGNPFYLEELIKVLIEDGVIVPGEPQWRLQTHHLTHVRIPPTLTGVLQARLDRLSTLERKTLQKASVVGRLFWDRSVSQMRDETGGGLDESEILVALQALQERELVFRRRSSAFAGAEAYVFKHAILRDVTYESVLLRQRPLYHKQVADWLVSESGERVGEYASGIAEHYEQAGENLLAARFYEVAAEQAQERYHPELAITYYRKELKLLADYPDLTVELLHVHEKLARLLQQQLRVVEASHIYRIMQHTAGLAGDLEAQARAHSGLAAIQRNQADYAGMLRQAEQAEQAARPVFADVELVRACHFQAEAHLALGNYAAAESVAREALALCERVGATIELMKSLRMLSLVHLRSGKGEQALPYLNRLAQQGALLQKQEASVELAFNQVQRGRLYTDLGQYNKAAQLLMAALSLYRDLDDQIEIGHTLCLLGEAALLQGNGRAAETLFEKALQVVQDIGNRRNELAYQIRLSVAQVAVKKYVDAIAHARQVIDMLQNQMRLINWRGLGMAYAVLAEAYLGLGNVDAAETAVVYARQLAEKGRDSKALGAAWRVMGLIAARKESPFQLEDKAHNASVCFSRGLRALRGPGDRTTWREQAHLLWQWAQYEDKLERHEKARQFRRRAERLVDRLDVTVQNLE